MATKKKPLRAIIYTRVSTADQNPQNQINELKAHAKKEGWEVVAVIKDKISGTTSGDERKGWNRVKKQASQGKFDVLLFWSLDRLSREGTRETLGYLQTLTDYGIKWHSLSEDYLSSLGVFADVVISILSTLAKQERIRISERTKAGMARAKDDGKIIGRPKGKLMQETIDRIADTKELRAKGWTFTRIGKKLGVSKQRAAQLYQMD